MSSAIANTTDSLPYGFAKDLRKACDVSLNRRDPKGAKVRRENSSFGRTQSAALRRATDFELLGELMRRQREIRNRQAAKERQKMRRDRKRKEGKLREPAEASSN